MLDGVFVAEELRSVGGSGMPSVQGMLDFSLVAPTLRMCAMAANKRASYGFTCGNGTRMRT